MGLSKQIFENTDLLNASFADTVATLLDKEISVNGKASLVVSGGRTPVGFFQVLSKQNIAWDKVVITLADDRWVDEQDDASNAKLVREHLLQNRAAEATFISLKTADEDAYKAQDQVAERLKQIAQPFTVVILGMGEDGHTASLFPCSEEVDKGVDPSNKDICLAVTPTTALHQRMSLTLSAITAAHHVFLHLTGETKEQVLAQAIADTKTPVKPIVSVVQKTDVTLFWAP